MSDVISFESETIMIQSPFRDDVSCRSDRSSSHNPGSRWPICPQSHSDYMSYRARHYDDTARTYGRGSGYSFFFVSLPLSTAIVFVLAGGLNCRLSRNLRLRLSCAYGWLSRKKIRVGHRDGWNSIGKVHSILRGVVCGNRTINDSTLIPEWTFARSPPG